MPRTCTICSNPERELIDKALLAGEPFRHIAARFGTSTSALVRHKSSDIPAALLKARDMAEVDYGDDLFAHVKDLNRRTLSILEQAEMAGDPRIALSAIRECRENAGLLAKMLEYAEASKSAEPEPLSVEAIMESFYEFKYGADWRRLKAEEEERIRKGLAIKCSNCGQDYIVPLEQACPDVTDETSLDPQAKESREEWAERLVKISEKRRIIS